MILAIDTATDEAGVAILDGEDLLAELSWRARGNHSRHLTGAIREIFRMSGVTPGALTSLAVAVGPGSFNGIRVGVSEAQGLAVALDLPVAGISTLDIIALPLCDGTRTVASVLPAGRGDVYLATYGGDYASFGRLGEYMRLPLGEVPAAVRLPALLAGPAADPAASLPGWDGGVSVAPRLEAHRRPGYLAELGRRTLLAGNAGDAAGLRPLYLRPSSAEEVRARGLQE